MHTRSPTCLNVSMFTLLQARRRGRDHPRSLWLCRPGIVATSEIGTFAGGNAIGDASMRSSRPVVVTMPVRSCADDFDLMTL